MIKVMSSSLGNGLKNVTGAQCFFNSTLQAIRHCRPIVSSLIDSTGNNINGSFHGALVNLLFDGCTINDLRNVLLQMKEKLGMNPRLQNDAHECMLQIINILFPDLSKCPMAGKLKSTIHCERCGESVTVQESLSQSLPIYTTNIIDGLELFEQSSEAGNCEKCNSKQTQTLSFDPNQVYVIHLKRKKIMSPPKELGDDFKLLAAVIHYGTSSFGHYITYVVKDDHVLRCDDESVTKYNLFPDDVPVYMLFYIRK